MKLQTIIAALTLSVCAASAQNVVPPPTIHISGSAEVKVVPDEIFLNVGVETRDPQLDKAVAQHNEQMTRALSFLRSSGIAPKDLQTDYIGVDPEFDSNVSRVKPAVYVVRKSIEIRLDSTADLEPTLTGLLTNGVNHVHNVDFRTTQLRKHRDQARAMAIRAAREKATALATELGVKCGKPVNITANDWGGGWMGSRGRWQPGGGYFNMYNMSQNSVQQSGGPADDDTSTLSIGQISVSASVNVTFELVSD
jgi:uncharacterized protein YggE